MHISFSTFSLEESTVKLLKRHPVKTLFFYSLMSELLILLLLFFAFLLTAEILLPGFISLRLNLTWYLIAILAASALLLFIGKTVDIRPPQKIRFEKFLLTLSGLWALGITTLSLHHFPWWVIVFLLTVFFIPCIWVWRSFFKDTKEA